MSSPKLEQRCDRSRITTALVLGAGSDIAAAIVAELGKRGLQHAALAARRPHDVVSHLTAATEGIEFTALQWDAMEIDSHHSLVESAIRAMGTLDMVICAVGQLGHHAGSSMTPGEVDAMVRTNFAGPAAALAAVGTAMASQGHGTIMVLSSVAAIRARRSNYVYGSSKAGLDSFAQGMGDALAAEGVRVLVVRPGFVTSKMTAGLDPAPFHTTPAAVAKVAVKALGGSHDVVTVPPLLTPMFAVLRNVPRGLWRRIAADR